MKETCWRKPLFAFTNGGFCFTINLALMKKLILSLVLLGVAFSFTPVFVKAEITQSAQQSPELKTQLIQLIIQMIAQLQQQINDILAQQALQQTALNNIQSNTQQIAQNTAPAPVIIPAPTPMPTPTPVVEPIVKIAPTEAPTVLYSPGNGNYLGTVKVNNSEWSYLVMEIKYEIISSDMDTQNVIFMASSKGMNISTSSTASRGFYGIMADLNGGISLSASNIPHTGSFVFKLTSIKLADQQGKIFNIPLNYSSQVVSNP